MNCSMSTSSNSSLVSNISNNNTTAVVLPFQLEHTITNTKSQFSNKKETYQLIKVLGVGSYAVVYLATKHIHPSNSNSSKVAIKCLSKSGLDLQLLQIQKQEVYYQKKLDHTNICKILDYFETDEWLFVVLEYVEGQDLFEYITTTPISNSNKDCYFNEKDRFFQIKPIFKQILKSVDYCHLNNVYHRDLKPENFVVDNKTCSVKLIDFGLATQEGHSNEFEIGSKPYMSFECRNESKNGYFPKLADIWSLGIIFLNLLYLRCPWAEPVLNNFEFSSFTTQGAMFFNREMDTSYSIAKYLTNHIFCDEDMRDDIHQFEEFIDNLYSEPNNSIKINNVIFNNQNTNELITPSNSPLNNNGILLKNNFNWADLDDDFDDDDNESIQNNNHSSPLLDDKIPNTILGTKKSSFIDKASDNYKNNEINQLYNNFKRIGIKNPT